MDRALRFAIATVFLLMFNIIFLPSVSTMSDTIIYAVVGIDVIMSAVILNFVAKS